MRSYRYADVGFDAPERWLDLSVVTLAAPGEGLAPSVELVRETAPKNVSIEAFAKRQVARAKRTRSAHQLVAEASVEVDGAPAYRLEHRFVTPEKIDAHQLQYFFAAGGEDIAILSLTCAADALAEHRPLFESIAASVRREPTDG